MENITLNPWIAIDTFTWELTRIGNRPWRERIELVNKVEILEWLLERNYPNIVIATDGSIHHDIIVWGGGRKETND